MREKAQLTQKQEILVQDAQELIEILGNVSVSNTTTDDMIRSLTLKTEKWKGELKSIEKCYAEIRCSQLALNQKI